MSRGWIVARVVLALLIAALLVGGGYALYRNAWAHGYAAGLAAEAGGEATAPLWYGHPYPVRPYGFGLGLFFAIGLGVLFFVFIGKMMSIAFWGRAMAGGPHPPDPHWARHWAKNKRWYHPHGPVPPWAWKCPPEEDAEEAEPDAETGDAE